MHHVDNEQETRISELVITTKLVSLIFLAIAIFIELPKRGLAGNVFLGIGFSDNLYLTLIACVILFSLFFLSILIVSFYPKRLTVHTYNKHRLFAYDIIELSILILLDTAIIFISGMSQSPYKIIYIFIMISTAIQYGAKYGLIISAICSAIIISIDVITIHEKPNNFLQIDLLLCGVYIMTTWILGYYRDVEMQYSLKMTNLAITDDLTGLYNHGYFQTTLNQKIKESTKNQKPLSLLFMDLDHFKYFNDLFGHQKGDDVLKIIGAKLSEFSNPSCFCARYGGEEFVILLSDTTEKAAIVFAEKLRGVVEATFSNKYDGIPSLTASIGVSCYPTKAKNKDELLKYADDALYRAKSFHRNRVEAYQSVLEELKHDIDDNDIDIISSLKTLISIINSKDRYTYRHVERVVVYCGIMADFLKLNDYEKKILKYSAYLHDIGKINIPQDVLNKKMPLSNDEWDLLKQHPAYGVVIISPIKSLTDLLPIILHHHERFDGNGYPEGLKGDDIPYLSRILTVADSFDAMTTNRPYGSAAKTFNEGIEELIACSSSQFDPEIAESFVKVLKRKNILFK